MKLYPKFKLHDYLPKTIEAKRRELVQDYRALAEWHRKKGDLELAADCEKAADQAAQLNLFEDEAGKEREKAKIKEKEKQTKLF